jgi:hypothetical protein
MKHRHIFLGNTPLKVNQAPVEGSFVDLDGERYFKITNCDLMPDFFLSIVSGSDLWMFISSNGSLSAGRKNSEGALFPYYSEDKIHDYKDITGSKTIILVKQDPGYKLWEPFQGMGQEVYSVKRNLYKNRLGNKLIFEEINEDLSLTFRYGWTNCDRFGFVKQSRLSNLGAESVEVDVLDGIQNILPCDVNSGLQSSSSNLLDAYKRQELIPHVALGIYRLSSVPSDTAEPSEALRVNTVWSEGLEGATILLSSLQLDAFRRGFPLQTEHDVKATRGAYFLNAPIKLAAGEVKDWNMVAEVDQDAACLSELMQVLEAKKGLKQLLEKQINQSTLELRKILASSDALQSTQDELSNSRHLTNVLFNVMRGGLYADGYRVAIPDFHAFITRANKGLIQAAKVMLGSSGQEILYHELLEMAGNQEDTALTRLCYEYLPLTFSRRHGDPSRPWNKFSIENRREDGSKNLDFQGNWRDIFQNWEALSLSFPGYIESIISKFVNATTPDGYNPYRITRNGIDWEVPDPSDPWSNIGYWGDHQLVYLLKFLELSVDHHPGRLHQLLSQDQFSYANVPYRIKPYGELVKDPRDTILFDADLEDQIRIRVSSLGSDGKLVWDENDRVMHVNLAEKLLVTLLSKLSNFIPGAGIWMNTQRPEWNDANNALVGSGVSMVTSYYLRAFLRFCTELFESYGAESVPLSEEVADLLFSMGKIIKDQLEDPDSLLKEAKACMDLLGEAGSEYRQRIYLHGFSGKRKTAGVDQILEFAENALRLTEHTISSNLRSDHLYHSYNLIREDGDRLKVRRLYEMLEGQVAVLSSGFLSVQEALALLDALKKSSLFREDQYSYILYPNRTLPTFLEKNKIPSERVEDSVLLKTLVEKSNHKILVRDVKGVYHFSGHLRNANLLKGAMEKLPEAYASMVAKESQIVLDIYEEVFDHQSFTGRSGTFYGYEGLGSIYWHMVSKLLLAVSEICLKAHSESANREVLGRLAEHYYSIRAGIGLNKNPELYGAFPTDPYSHTPASRGAQQPGMTGQVKEDIIARWRELGIRIREGSIRFQPILLRKQEFLTATREFACFDLEGNSLVFPLEINSLAFTYCQVPVLYHLSEEQRILLNFKDGSKQKIIGESIDVLNSSEIFRRTGEITQIDVWLTPQL